MMKKITAIIMSLMMVLTLTQCKKDNTDTNTDTNSDVKKVKVSCVIPLNNGSRSEFDNLMIDGTVKWSAGTERIYLAIPDAIIPQIVELTAFTTVESNILLFEGEVSEGLLTEGEYDIWYLGNSKNLDLPNYFETKDEDIVKSITGSIASQSGSLDDLGYCHIATTKVTAETIGEEIVLSLNGTLKNQIAIAHLDLTDITNLKGDAIIGTEYALQYNNGTFEFNVTEDPSANIEITEGTATSYVVLFPNAATNIDLKSNTSKMVTFEGGIAANKIYYKRVSDMEFYPLTWEDYEDENSNLINGYEYVDLGLPSGLKWATCNVGATTPEEYGDHFAWGDIETKSSYTSSNYSTYNVQITDISGNAQYDAATANWGGSWRMPTKDEMNELRNNCTWEWTQVNGVNGYKVIGPNENTIFLPAAGYRSWELLKDAGTEGFYWSSTDYKNDFNIVNYALSLTINSKKYTMGGNDRGDGRTVRPVSE